MNQWITKNASRLTIGIALLVLPILYMISAGTDFNRLNPHRHEIQNLLTYLTLIAFSYVNHTIFVPRWYQAKKYGRYMTVVAGCLLGVALIPHRLEQWVFLKAPENPTPIGWIGQLLWKENLFRPHQPPGEHRPGPPPGVDRRPPMELDGMFPTTPLSVKLGIIFLLGTISALTSISVQTGTQLRRVENEKLLAELNELKAQIQPHFLFNTLNSIYALALRKDDRTAETIVKLSEFMRYMIRDAHNDQVSLAKEVHYIANYIDLQQARLRDAVAVEYTVEGTPNGIQIAPLILFSFIENAFKHGVNPDEESVIRIKLLLKPTSLHLQVYNRKVHTSPLESSNGIGLPNAKERLRLLYPAAHTLLIDDIPDHFLVNLTMTLL